MFGRLGMYYHVAENRDLKTQTEESRGINATPHFPSDRLVMMRLVVVLVAAVGIVALVRSLAA